YITELDQGRSKKSARWYLTRAETLGTWGIGGWGGKIGQSYGRGFRCRCGWTLGAGGTRPLSPLHPQWLRNENGEGEMERELTRIVTGIDSGSRVRSNVEPSASADEHEHHAASRVGDDQTLDSASEVHGGGAYIDDARIGRPMAPDKKAVI